MAANFINLTDTLEEWRVKANEVYGKVGDLDTLVKDSTVAYTGIVGTNASNFTGTHATFTITRFNGTYSASVTDGGSGYDVGDVVLVDGTLLGGSSGINDATITITEVDPGFAALAVSVDGDAVGDLISEVNGLRAELGSLLNFSLNTDTSTFYEAVNELENIIRTETTGDANYELTTDAHNLIAAINEIEAALRGANVDYVLNTDANDLVSAVNEFQSEIGRVEDLSATGTPPDRVTFVDLGDNVVAALNSLKLRTDDLSSNVGGDIGDHYDGPHDNILDALNSVYNAASTSTLDAQYVRADGTRGMDADKEFDIGDKGINSGSANFLIKTADSTRINISPATGNVGINRTPSNYKFDVNGTANATKLSYNGQDTDLRYARSSVNPDGSKSITDDTIYEGNTSVSFFGTIVTEDNVVVQRQEGDDNDYSFLEWTQDQVGSMFTGNSESGGISGVYDDTTGKITLAVANNSHTHLSGNITDFVEAVQDVTGGMVSGNTENGITVTYNDTTGRLNFDVNDPTITISGEATGSAVMTNLGNTNISVILDHEAIQDAVGEMLTGNTETGLSVTYNDAANKIDFALTADPKIILSGDVSGNVTLTNLATGDYTITATVADNSHNHTPANITGFTEAIQDIIGGMVNPANVEAGLNVYYDDNLGKLNFDVNDPTFTLTGDVTGTATQTNLGSVSITTTIANDSHTHDTRYYTKSETDGRYLLNTTDTLSGSLTVTSDIYVGSNGGGDSNQHFYDDNSNTWRTLQWDDTANEFRIEDNGGTMRSIIHTGTIGSQSVSSAIDATNSSKIYGTQRDTNATYYLGFVAGTGTGNKDLSFDDQISVNPSSNTINCTNFNGTSTRAKYADLAENYLADAEYPVGTVMCIGGDAEVTQSNESNHHSVLGVVSDKPAYLMNSELEGGTTVALKGRVPVRVIGMVKKGDRLAPSPVHPGLAEVNNDRNAWSFAIALEDKSYTVVASVEAVIL